MSAISRVTTWSDNQVLTSSALNGEFNNILNDYNGGITNANISPSAAIATSKINATFPAGAIVGTTDSQALTNKTITAAILSGIMTGTYTLGGNPTLTNAILTTAFTASGMFDNGTTGGTVNIDWTKGDRQKVTLNAITTFTYSGATSGQIMTLLIVENSTGGYTITLPTSKWPGGSAGTFTTTANAKNTLTVLYDGTDYLSQVGSGYA